MKPRIVFALCFAFFTAAICCYQEWIHVDLNSKQVFLLYWKQRISLIAVSLAWLIWAIYRGIKED